METDRWVPLTVGSAPEERHRVSLSSFYFNCVHTPEFYPKTQLTGSNHSVNSKTETEITNSNVDELSVKTYVSYFPAAKLKPGALLQSALGSPSYKRLSKYACGGA